MHAKTELQLNVMHVSDSVVDHSPLGSEEGDDEGDHDGALGRRAWLWNGTGTFEKGSSSQKASFKTACLFELLSQLVKAVTLQHNR